MTFWYRRSPTVMLVMPTINLPLSVAGAVTASNPPETEPGSLLLRLDLLGRMTLLRARPMNRVAASTRLAPEWSRIFDAAGLDLARFTPVAPERIPSMAIDSQQAWTGDYGGGRTEAVRVEAASFQGRPVFFEVSGPADQFQTALSQPLSWLPIAFLSLLIGCLITTALVAARTRGSVAPTGGEPPDWLASCSSS